LRSDILAAGGSRDPGEAYRAFRGQLPTADALLRKRGFAEAVAGGRSYVFTLPPWLGGGGGGYLVRAFGGVLRKAHPVEMGARVIFAKQKPVLLQYCSMTDQPQFRFRQLLPVVSAGERVTVGLKRHRDVGVARAVPARACRFEPAIDHSD